VEQVAELPFVRAVLSARTRVELTRLVRRLETGAPVHGVSLHRSLLDEGLVTWLHRHVDVVMTWPVNDVDALESVVALGADGVISDEPSVLATLLVRRTSEG
jgi:glycerophosphoryl diester phosphodiesterase